MEMAVGKPARDGLNASVLAARNGDHAAFADLVQRFTAPLHRYFTTMGLTRADAEDVLQETFLRAYQHLERYDSTYAFSTWLYTIGRRLALNHLTRQRPRTDIAAADETAAQSAGPISDSLWEHARKLLAERDFSALWLRYGEDRDLADISAILSVSVVNARVILHRARERLASALGPDHRP